jgi:endonuclease/exonuclease/phosphatase family metal-dependent hydrolase
MNSFVKIAVLLSVSLWATASFAETVRVATWNINNLNDKSDVPLRDRAPIRVDADYDALKRYRDLLGADVIALQEMGNPAAVERVFPSAEYDVAFAKDYDPSGEPDIYAAIVVRKGGPAKLIQSGDVEGLQVVHEVDGRTTRRGIEALIEVGGKQFWVLGVHLKSACFGKSLVPATDANCVTLAKQMAPLEAWIDGKESSGLPLIVAGDFNRKFDIHGQTDHLWAEVDDSDPSTLNLWRVPFGKASECPTTREGDRKHPIDFLVFNQSAWDRVDPQSYVELLYEEEEAAELGNRLSDHCPRAVDLRFE